MNNLNTIRLVFVYIILFIVRVFTCYGCDLFPFFCSFTIHYHSNTCFTILILDFNIINNIAIQGGAVIAVLFNFTDRVKQLVFKWREPEARDYMAKLLVAFFITGCGGVLIDTLGFELPEEVLPVALALLIGGILFVVVEKRLGDRQALTQVTWAIAIAIGFGQLIAAVFPGASRSGSTILIALLMGLKRVPAIEFTFLLGVPTLLAAGAYKVLKALGTEGVSEDWWQLALASLVSAVTAFVSVKWLLRYIETHTFVVFGWYRIALGLILLIITFT